MQNPCSSVVVQTEGGVYSSTTDRILVDGGSIQAEVGRTVDLLPLRSEFVATNDSQAAFWVLPLTNFVIDDWKMYCGSPEIIQHPLRLFTTPQVPSELVGHDFERATLIANSQNQLLTFSLGDSFGFIEPLPGYTKRVKRLTEREPRNKFTAVAVGPAHVQRVCWDDGPTLFPIDVLALLNLSTGNRVGAPWVEFRDAAGKLVRRCHIPFGESGYRSPRPAIRCHRRNAIGYLLGRGFASGELGKSYLRVVLHHACAAAKRGTQETQFLTLCRAFETICHEHGVRNHDLSAMLTDTQRQSVTRVLNGAQRSIRDMAQSESDSRRQDALRMIANRVGSAAQKEKDFGVKVCDLAARYGLHDAMVLDAYFSAHPIRGCSTWAAVLSAFRGAATHEAFFDIGGRHDLWEIQRLKDHLYDLLLRIVWKIVGYDGPYETPIPPTRTLDDVNWVTAATSPTELGFG